MQSATVDDILTATILVGLLLSVASLLISVLNGRTSQMAQIKASSNLRALYERDYRKTPFASRRFVSIVRPGKAERRGVTARDAAPRDGPSRDPPSE